MRFGHRTETALEISSPTGTASPKDRDQRTQQLELSDDDDTQNALRGPVALCPSGTRYLRQYPRRDPSGRAVRLTQQSSSILIKKKGAKKILTTAACRACYIPKAVCEPFAYSDTCSRCAGRQILCESDRHVKRIYGSPFDTCGER
jgi:hypothetical protein